MLTRRFGLCGPFLFPPETMFCPACQQDVPALAVPEEPGVVRCTYCGEGLESQGSEVRGQGGGDRRQGTENSGIARSSRVSDPAETTDRRSPVSSLPPTDLADWDLEPDLRAADRILANLRQSAPVEESTLAPHAAHAQLPDWHVPVPVARPAQPITPKGQPASPEKSGTLAWTCLSLGVMALACGGVLIAWSLAANRGDLWSLGLPLAVVGQGGLVIGLLLQLDGLWQSSKKTEQTLTQLDDKLHELRHTTTLLGSSHSTPAQSFYVHMAEGASPHLLLADLKGQLDLLAQKMARKS